MPPGWEEVFVGSYYREFITNKNDIDNIDENKL